MNDPDLEIKCEKHGSTPSAVVCGHLINNHGKPLGFIENSSIPGDFQAWCYACEHVFLEEEDKTERFTEFTNMSMICEECYKEIKNAHNEKKT